ncbi:MAG TPA: hypothetical protein VMZ73_06240 [Acidimicrobiales bacterium]|nr:hypothetical protein [Acidimicrobiales bacterium]
MGRVTSGSAGAPRKVRAELRARLRPVVRELRDRGRSGYSNTGEDMVIDRLLAGVDGPQFCVDIGAGDGRTMSNLLALFERGWRGLSVEMDGESFKSLAALHARFPGSSLYRGRIDPDNVLEVLRAARTPADFGVLSLDIDGYDFFVLDRLLTSYRPAIICTEVNEKIPPPLRFTVLYSPTYSWDQNHFYGQSTSQLNILCERYGYAIVELQYNNAFLMPADLAPSSLTPEEAYRSGYADRHDRRAKFPWNADMEELQILAPDHAVEFLRARFAKYEGMYSLDAGED